MNRLKVSQQETIVTLWKRGWSARRIARELGLDRDTARKYIQLAQAKPATPSPGSDVDGTAKPATPTLGSEGAGEAKPATPSPGLEASSSTAIRNDGGGAEHADDTPSGAALANVSLCAVWKQQIEAALDQGLTAKRIHQDLVREHGFAGSYQSVVTGGANAAR